MAGKKRNAGNFIYERCFSVFRKAVSPVFQENAHREKKQQIPGCVYAPVKVAVVLPRAGLMQKIYNGKCDNIENNDESVRTAATMVHGKNNDR